MTDIEKTIATAQILTKAMATEGWYPDAYGAVRIADHAVRLGLTTKDDRSVVGPVDTDHDSLVEFCRNNDDITAWCIQRFVANNQKIHAIKILRRVAGCGLKEAKEAVDAYAASSAL